MVVAESPPRPQPLRCWRCEKLLAERITPPYRIICERCKAVNAKDIAEGHKEA